MDPVTTTLVSAIVVGAAKGVSAAAEDAVGQAYAGLKKLLIAGYTKASSLIASVTAIEKKPESQPWRDVLAEELKASGALDDEELVAAAEALLKLAEKSPEQTIGVDWSDVKAASLTIEKIKARAGTIGFRAARMEIMGEVRIGEIDTGEPSGKPLR